MVKFDKIYGENGENIEGVFVHKKANTYENQQSIVAEKGKFVPAANKNFLKLVLYNGYVFEDNFAGKGDNVRQKQPDQAIKFDTLVSHFDISEIINKAIEKEQITDDYRFQTYNQLNETIVRSKKENKQFFDNVGSDVLNQTNSVVSYMDKGNRPKVAPKSQIKLDTVKGNKKLDIIYFAYNRLDNLKSTLESKKNEVSNNVKYFSKVVIYQQRIISYSVTCIIFLPDRSQFRIYHQKRRNGTSCYYSYCYFHHLYVMNVGVENMSWSGKMNPYLAAWLPNFILLPFWSLDDV
jgi:lipopolysaccharide export system permease protein